MTIPIHPLVVHFPIALILSALLVDTLAMVFRKPHWHQASLWNLGLGVLGAAVAVRTGEAAEETVERVKGLHQVLERHEQFGTWALWLGVVLVAWRLLRRDRMGPWLRGLTVAVTAVLAAFVSVGGYLGGRMVYEFGAGQHHPRSQQTPAGQPHDEPHHHDEDHTP